MKHIGDKVVWNTVNGPREGVVENICVSYLVKTDEGKCVILNDDNVNHAKE